MRTWERAGSEIDLADAVYARGRNTDGQARLGVDGGPVTIMRSNVASAWVGAHA